MISLEEKIKLLERKKDLLRSNYTIKEMQGLIDRLKYRKYWEETKSFFLEFPTTNDEKLEKFLDKYSHLRMGIILKFLFQIFQKKQLM